MLRHMTKAGPQKDFLDQLVRERTKRNPDFARRVDMAVRRRETLRALAVVRQRQGLSQTAVARAMKTSQPAVARIESGDFDVRASTMERYAAAIGKKLEYRIA
jgi:ribosome-binding protein aMBF1 (putative translation factor)